MLKAAKENGDDSGKARLPGLHEMVSQEGVKRRFPLKHKRDAKIK